MGRCAYFDVDGARSSPMGAKLSRRGAVIARSSLRRALARGGWRASARQVGFFRVTGVAKDVLCTRHHKMRDPSRGETPPDRLRRPPSPRKRAPDGGRIALLRTYG